MARVRHRPDVIEEAIRRHGIGEKSLIPVLREVQRAEGYLSREILCRVAKGLRLSIEKVYETTAENDEFCLHRRHSIRVCNGTACHIEGADAITEALKEELKIDVDETTPDERFTLQSMTCLGCCSLAPAIMVDDRTHGRLAPETAKRVIKQYKHHE